MAHAESLWDHPGEEPPRKGDKAAKIKGDPPSAFVDHIWSMLDADEYINSPELERRRRLRAACKEIGGSWEHVSRILRQQAIAARARSGQQEEVEYTESGIPVFPERFALDEYSPICKVKLKSFDMGLWTVRHYDKDCGSLSERRCGPREAERLLRRVRLRIGDLGEVHFAECDYEDDLSNRMGQRRYARKLETFTYQDVNDSVTYLANGPIGGTAPPRTSRPVKPDEALKLLIPRLWVPGHTAHRFSKRWEFPGDTLDDGGVNVSLDSLDDGQVGEFKARADAMLREEYEIEPATCQLPAHLWADCRQKLIEIRNSIQRGE